MKSLEMGTAVGVPGEIVEVPARVTSTAPICSYAVAFRYDPGRLDYLSYSPAVPDGDLPLSPIFHDTGEGDGAFGIFSCIQAGDFELPPGTGVLIGVLRFRVLATASEGSGSSSPDATRPSCPS